MSGELSPPKHDSAPLEGEVTVPGTLTEVIAGRVWYDSEKNTIVIRGAAVTPDQAGIEIPDGEQLIEVDRGQPAEVNNAVELALGALARQPQLPSGDNQA